MRNITLTLVALLAAGTLLAACGDDSSTGGMDHAADDTSNSSTEPMEGHEGNSPVADGARRIEVSATSFEFGPVDLDVDTGEDIAIVLSSDDIDHDFTIDELDAHVAAAAGDSSEGGFTADEPGTYTYYCSVEGHREAGMEGTLTVN